MLPAGQFSKYVIILCVSAGATANQENTGVTKQPQPSGGQGAVLCTDVSESKPPQSSAQYSNTLFFASINWEISVTDISGAPMTLFM